MEAWNATELGFDEVQSRYGDALDVVSRRTPVLDAGWDDNQLLRRVLAYVESKGQAADLADFLVAVAVNEARNA